MYSQVAVGMDNGQSSLTDRSMTLTRSIVHICHDAGIEIDFDDLHAALGLSWMVCAVPSEPREMWSMHARDVFVVPATRLFGLRLRDLHPPEAAVGLDRAAEFEQHFDASYRPLIHRALEHKQPVLAWRGWQGEVGPNWGVIQAASDEGAGFVGLVPEIEGMEIGFTERTLELPALQVYVVEVIEPVKPKPDELFRMAVEHGRRALGNELPGSGERICGDAEIDWWERLRNDESKQSSTIGMSDPDRILFDSILANGISGLRFLKRLEATLGKTEQLHLHRLLPACEGFIHALQSMSVGDDSLQIVRDGLASVKRAFEAVRV